MSETLLGVIIGSAIAILPTIITTFSNYIFDRSKSKYNNKKDAYRKALQYLYESYTAMYGLQESEFLEYKDLEEDCLSLLVIYGTTEILKKFKTFCYEKNKFILSQTQEESDKIIAIMKKLYDEICILIKKDLKNKK